MKPRINRDELIKKRNQYIHEAATVILGGQKDRIVWRPDLFEYLVSEELEKRSCFEKLSDEHKKDFLKEFNNIDISAQIDLYFNIPVSSNRRDLLSKKLEDYCIKN